MTSKDLTRRRLLDATVVCLIEHGYARTTSSQIAATAGLSEGTIFKHFGTKPGLYGAVAEYVLSDVRADALRAFLDADPDQDPIDRAVLIAWDVYRRDDLVAVHELFTVARTNPDLATRLQTLDAPHREALHELAAASLPAEAAARPDFNAIVDLILDAIGDRHLWVGHRDDAGAQAAALALILRTAHLLLSHPTDDVTSSQPRTSGRTRPTGELQ
ncbi:MAG: AcrR family transcriptional regulator [Glaciecola sp.]|jgi:AcrR family transcriptional regulator